MEQHSILTYWEFAGSWELNSLLTQSVKNKYNIYKYSSQCVWLYVHIIHLHHFLCSQNLLTTAHSPLRSRWGVSSRVVTDLHDKSKNLIIKARRIRLKRAKTVHTVKVIIHRGSVLPHPLFCKKRVWSCPQTWHESNLRQELQSATQKAEFNAWVVGIRWLFCLSWKGLLLLA